MAAQTRRSRTPKKNERNQTTVKVGGRNDYRIFKFSDSVSPKELEARRNRLKDIYAACGGWNELSSFIATHVHKGVTPVPFPPNTSVLSFRRTLMAGSTGGASW